MSNQQLHEVSRSPVDCNPCIAEASASHLELGWYVPSNRGYAGRQRARWVLALDNGRVLYSRGGEQHFECTAGTFLAWVKRVSASLNPEEVQSNKPESPQLDFA